MAKRNLYLKTTPAEEAGEKYMQALEEAGCLKPQTEIVNTYESLNRITAEPIFAKCCSPLFNSAAMDGIAVKSAKTAKAKEERPLILEPGTGYKIIDTGDPVKSPFDAVVMAEDVIEESGSDRVMITRSVPGWQHVRPIGEDIAAGEMLLPSHHTIRPVDIGVLLAGGILSLKTFKKPTVSIIPTGTEIIMPYENPSEGDIIDSHSGMFAAMVTEAGGIPHRRGIVPDDYQQIKEAVLGEIEKSDVVIINAGSSAGTEDYTVHVLREIGEVIIHGVAM